jgi:2-oxo-4-hydroxy-4-carboxy-5-ureidoimidazoline decarboxylase
MEIEEFDTMDATAARELVRSCADIPSWVEAVVAARPYAETEELFRRAEHLALDWTGAEVEQALADHPRIGERHAGSGTSAAMSAREQAGVDPADTDVKALLAAANAAYEERFDRIFLVRAAGRSSVEILEFLEQRLGNDPESELEVTTGQLREIAALRLRGLFSVVDA